MHTRDISGETCSLRVGSFCNGRLFSWKTCRVILLMVLILMQSLWAESTKQPQHLQAKFTDISFFSSIPSLDVSSFATLRGGDFETDESTKSGEREEMREHQPMVFSREGASDDQAESKTFPVAVEAATELMSNVDDEKENEEVSYSEYTSTTKKYSSEHAKMFDDSEKNAAMIKAIESATKLRLDGKDVHDQGDFIKAAELFEQAANMLLENDQTTARLSEEYATCRLHQALCQLKSGKFDLCIDTCTDVLQDADGQEQEAGHISVVTFTTKSPAVKSRAYHRRAKAKIGLGDTAGALQDARTAAFLGDAKAVALYGKLMRESSSSEISSALNPLHGSQSLSSSSTLLESLLQKSDGAGVGSVDGLSDYFPLSFLTGKGGGNILDVLGSGAGESLAKSLLKNLSKRLDESSTHEQISTILQSTNRYQLRSLASMAGMSDALEDNHLDAMVNFCHGVTPKHIRRTVRATKVMVYTVKLMRRLVKLLNKYKTLLAALLILQWTKSATFRPIPINKKAATLAAKKALQEGMKATRGLY
jgi:hypothetical protein